jgi:oligopeptide/dipeptide ABC transporter ATP-binding protein
MSDDLVEMAALLSVRDLRTYFFLSAGRILKAVDGVSFKVNGGRTLGIVGESGSGKSVTARSILRVVEEPGRIVGGQVIFDGQDLLSLSQTEMAHVRGKRISMIFQDPGTALDPLFTVGSQFLETIQVHTKVTKQEAEARAIQALTAVGVPQPSSALKQFPMDFSAGMTQRIMAGLAISCEPELILADEPTTTLGVTVQAQILETLADIQAKLGMAMILITHDFGVISQMAHDVFVMYAGKCMEYGPMEALLVSPRHPYTVGLISSVPSIETESVQRLKTIPGFPPDMLNLPGGCPFSPRCERATAECATDMPLLTEMTDSHWVACYNPM